MFGVSHSSFNQHVPVAVVLASFVIEHAAVLSLEVLPHGLMEFLPSKTKTKNN